jgi:hypothetical protein
MGDFLIEGAPLLRVASPSSMDDETINKLNAAFSVSRQRTVETDAAFGIRQIVDIAMKALSPGINDTTTAVMCIDYLVAILVRLAPRKFAPTHCLDEGKLRLITREPSFEGLLAQAFDQIRQNGAGNVAIMHRMLDALHTIAGRPLIQADGEQLMSNCNGSPSWPNAPSDPRATGHYLRPNWRSCTKHWKKKRSYQRINNRQRNKYEDNAYRCAHQRFTGRVDTDSSAALPLTVPTDPSAWSRESTRPYPLW